MNKQKIWSEFEQKVSGWDQIDTILDDSIEDLKTSNQNIQSSNIRCNLKKYFLTDVEQISLKNQQQFCQQRNKKLFNSQSNTSKQISEEIYHKFYGQIRNNSNEPFRKSRYPQVFFPQQQKAKEVKENDLKKSCSPQGIYKDKLKNYIVTLKPHNQTLEENNSLFLQKNETIKIRKPFTNQNYILKIKMQYLQHRIQKVSFENDKKYLPSTPAPFSHRQNVLVGRTSMEYKNKVKSSRSVIYSKKNTQQFYPNQTFLEIQNVFKNNFKD